MAKVFFVFLCLAASIANADFDAAAEAYRNKNYPLAYQLFEPLAAAGDARAQTVLAMMHKYGESVPASQEKALDWYQRAAQSGYAPAMFNLGDMYSRGQGTQTNIDEAILWLEKSARAGFTRANARLAELDAATVTGARVDETVPWSQSWNFRLPNNIRYGQAPEAGKNPRTAYRVQLGAMGSPTAARRLWDQLTERHPELFDSLEPIISLSENNTRRVYRVQTGPFDDMGSARQFCDSLFARSNQVGCLPVQ